MGQLGDVLALMYGAYDRFATVTAVGRHWHDPGLQNAAVMASSTKREKLPAEIEFLLTAPYPPQVTTTRLWVELPGRMRAEQEHASGDERVSSSMVVDGQQWWHHEPRFGARFGVGHPKEMTSMTVSGFEKMLDPRGLLSCARARVVGEEAKLGRAGIRLAVVAGPAARGTSFDTEVVVDAERGVLLEVVRRFDGQVVDLKQWESLVFDEALAPDTWVFVSPDGQPPLPVPERQEVTLGEAASVCPFPVFAPTDVPDGWSPGEISYWPGWERSGHYGERVSWSYGVDKTSVHLVQHEGVRCSLPEEGTWKTVVRNGQGIEVFTAEGGHHRVELRRGPTSISFQVPAEVDVEGVIRMASSLTEVAPAFGPDAVPEKFPDGAGAWPLPHRQAGRLVTVDPPSTFHPRASMPASFGRLLEAIHGPGESFGTLRATLRSRWGAKAWTEGADPEAGPSGEWRSNVTPIELRDWRGDPRPVERERRRDRAARTHRRDRGVAEDGSVLARMHLVAAEELEREGRGCLRLTATSEAGLNFPRRGMMWGLIVLVERTADRVELVVDIETGVVLEARSWRHDHLVRTVELTDVELLPWPRSDH